MHEFRFVLPQGGALLGCSAGFLNSVKIKGSHTAIKSGMVAGEAVYGLLAADEESTVATTGEIDPEQELLQAGEYQSNMEKSWVRLACWAV